MRGRRGSGWPGASSGAVAASITCAQIRPPASGSASIPARSQLSARVSDSPTGSSARTANRATGPWVGTSGSRTPVTGVVIPSCAASLARPRKMRLAMVLRGTCSTSATSACDQPRTAHMTIATRTGGDSVASAPSTSRAQAVSSGVAFGATVTASCSACRCLRWLRHSRRIATFSTHASGAS